MNIQIFYRRKREPYPVSFVMEFHDIVAAEPVHRVHEAHVGNIIIDTALASEYRLAEKQQFTILIVCHTSDLWRIQLTIHGHEIYLICGASNSQQISNASDLQ